MTTEKESGEETVYEESGGEKAPYVSKEILPEIEGVLVVAEGETAHGSFLIFQMP